MGDIFENLFVPNKRTGLTRDEMAELLKTTPEALDGFERAYSKAFGAEDHRGEFFKQPAKDGQAASEDGGAEGLGGIIARVVDELLGQTRIYRYDGENGAEEVPMSLPGGTGYIRQEDLAGIPERLRPQATGCLQKRDILQDASPMILMTYKKYLEESDPAKKRGYYHYFRQGLDIQDLDPIMYAIIDTNPTSMGHWLPALAAAADGQGFFKIPKTTIAKIPLSILQLSRIGYGSINGTTHRIVNEFCMKAFSLDEDGDYFIRTGTASSKFFFRNAHVVGPEEVRTMGDYFLYGHCEAVEMAGPLAYPCMYGRGTTVEWAVREFIPARPGTPEIYHGMPLRPEFRVFIEPGSDDPVLAVVPYWDPVTMKKRFTAHSDADTADMKHDYVIYAAYEGTLMRLYEENKDRVAKEAGKLAARLDLPGQWSLDVMMGPGADGREDTFYLIDMAVAKDSAYYDRVPEERRHPLEENWLPRIGDSAGLH